ncbi:MAG: hypothetical protein HGA96_08635 [Desulfobulbaceae bacterium]|nr:hypothetical protein [Desulfobulbaceae bacterium]
MAGPRIALLLSGLASDLPAGVTAVQLAGRTESRLFVLQKQGGEAEQLAGYRFVSEFAALEGVSSNCHLLGEGTVTELADLLSANAITWLVVGAWAEELRPRQNEWLDKLRAQLRASPDHFSSELQVIVAPPLAEGDLERIISQSRRLSNLAVGTNQKFGNKR